MNSPGSLRSPRLRISIVLVATLLMPAAARAQFEDPDSPAQKAVTPEVLAGRSLALRTALHHDPTLAAPLERLMDLYRQAGKVDDLLNIYRSHLAQYPADVNGQVVFARLLAAADHRDAASTIRAAVERFPQQAFLRFLHFEALSKARDPKAVDELDHAIDLEPLAGRKLAWIDRLLPEARLLDRKDLLEKHLEALGRMATSGEAALEAAVKMGKYGLDARALALLETKFDPPPSPEVAVSLQMEAAGAEFRMGRREAAAARLDRLLARLTADYWRRPEIVHRRLAMVGSSKDQETMIAAARKRLAEHPRDEAVVLDLAQVLAGLERRREALAVLEEAGRSLPKSEALEKRTLELLETLHDPETAHRYLAGRLKLQPDRVDLVFLQIKALYELGRSREALASLSEATRSSADRLAVLLEMARFLRRQTMGSDAAELYRQVLATAPQRLDVLRELAEVYRSLSDRDRLRGLFRGSLSQEATLENFLDLIQFMIKEDLHVEALSAVRERSAKDPQNLELRLLMVDLNRRLGNAEEGEKLVVESRDLADTSARYRTWLDAAIALYAEFDRAEAFLAEEQARLDGEPGAWSPAKVERRMALADAASVAGRKAEVVAMLDRDLAGKPPAEIRVRLRLQRLRALENDAAQADAIIDELKRLIDDDPAHASEYRARLVLRYSGGQRFDQIQELLPQIDAAQIRDVSVLQQLAAIYPNFNEGSRMLKLCQRLAELEPANRSNWERWLTQLAASGDEAMFCQVLRRLLAGIDKMPLAEETRQLIEEHLVDSHWRSLAECLADPSPSRLLDGLVLLDSLERLKLNASSRLWVAWTRAYVLHRLDRLAGRDEAIAELTRLASLAQATAVEEKKPAGDKLEEKKPESQQPPGPPRVTFPDGISVSVDHARQLLSAKASDAATGTQTRHGPLPELSVRWVFETDRGLPVRCIVPVSDACLLIGDREGTGFCVDSANGKVVWQRKAMLPMPPPLSPNASSPYGPYYNYNQDAAADRTLGMPPPLAADGRIYVPGLAEITCYSSEDGRMLWQADVGSPGKRTAGPFDPPFVAAFLYGDKLAVFEPQSGCVTMLDAAGGKILREIRVGAGEPAPLAPANCGASLSGDRLLVYGSKAAIVNLATGEAEWSFEPGRVREMPLKLSVPAARATVAANPYASSGYMPYNSPFVGYFGGRRFVYGPGPYGPYGTSSPVQFFNYLRHQSNVPAGVPLRLCAPAVCWAASVLQGGPRRGALHGPWMVLADGQGLQILRTDLPLAGRQIPGNGQILGMAGPTVCLLQMPSLQFVDLHSGSMETCILRPQGDEAKWTGVCTRVALDGPMVYVSDPSGIACYHASGVKRIFHVPWPKDVASLPVEPAQTPASPSPWNPYSGMPQPNPGAIDVGRIRVCHAAGNTLYTTYSPDRVVALVGSDRR